MALKKLTSFDDANWCLFFAIIAIFWTFYFPPEGIGATPESLFTSTESLANDTSHLLAEFSTFPKWQNILIKLTNQTLRLSNEKISTSNWFELQPEQLKNDYILSIGFIELKREIASEFHFDSQWKYRTLDKCDFRELLKASSTAECDEISHDVNNSIKKQKTTGYWRATMRSAISSALNKKNEVVYVQNDNTTFSVVRSYYSEDKSIILTITASYEALLPFVSNLKEQDKGRVRTVKCVQFVPTSSQEHSIIYPEGCKVGSTENKGICKAFNGSISCAVEVQPGSEWESRSKWQLNLEYNIATLEVPWNILYIINEFSREIALATVIITVYTFWKWYTDHKIWRDILFWKVALKTYAHYKWVLRTKDPDVRAKEVDKLHHKYAKILFQTTTKLGGFYVKMGQEYGCDPDVVPKPFVPVFRALEDKVPPRPFSEIIATLESAFGKPSKKVFKELDPKPLGSASIGQVHRAVLVDGREVCVKVQYSGIEELFLHDFKSLRMFVENFMEEAYKDMLSSYESHFLEEFDYRVEARHLATASKNLEMYDEYAIVPKPINEYCRKTALTMQYLRGVKLSTGLQERMEKWAKQHGKELKEFQKGKDNDSDEMIKYMLPVVDAVRYVGTVGYNYFYGEWADDKSEFVPLTPPIDIDKIIDVLYEIHGKALIDDGFFNGDPHPGNILLLEDDRLGLIDYGQVSVFSLDNRKKLCRLFLALADDDRPNIIRYFQDMGYCTKNNYEESLYMYAKVMYDLVPPHLYKGKPEQQYWEELDQRDPMKKFPKQFSMAVRMIWLLRMVSQSINVKIAPAQHWRARAHALLYDRDESTNSSIDHKDCTAPIFNFTPMKNFVRQAFHVTSYDSLPPNILAHSTPKLRRR